MLASKDLTNGERLLLQRRRDKYTKAQAAEWHEVTLYRYNMWEADEEKGPACKVGRLALHEKSLLLRLRAGVTAKAFAGLLGVSPWWLRQMEAGDVSGDRLKEYWAG